LVQIPRRRGHDGQSKKPSGIRANSLQSKLLELSGGGAASALEGSGTLRGKYLTQFRAVLDQLRPLLQSTIGTTSLR
jgi:hypothetical protein